MVDSNTPSETSEVMPVCEEVIAQDQDPESTPVAPPVPAPPPPPMIANTRDCCVGCVVTWMVKHLQ